MTPDQLALEEAAKKLLSEKELHDLSELLEFHSLLEYSDAERLLSSHFALLSRIRELEEKLFEAHLDICWNDYHQGIERDGKWQNGAMSDAERLQRESGMGGEWIDAAALKEQLPIIAKSRASAALGGQSQ